jgi:riboflavin synthase
MFTGLVQTVATIAEVQPTQSGCCLTVDCSGWDHDPALGASIAVAGCCLTVAQKPSPGLLVFDVVAQTLRCTTLGSLETGSRVNLEHAARADTLLGGHIVQGHIDGVGEIISVLSTDAEHRLTIQPPVELAPLIPPKGSIAIDGVSLTVAAFNSSPEQPSFEIALIPTTLEQTTLGECAAGDPCNLETDILARTVAHWLTQTSSDA